MAQLLQKSFRAAFTNSSIRSYSSHKNISLTSGKYDFLKEFGITEHNKGVYDGTWRDGNGKIVTSHNPATGETIATTSLGNVEDYEKCIQALKKDKNVWSEMPAPLRGEVVRKIGDRLRKRKSALGSIISLEVGKIYVEGMGEVQEAIDICDFATGLSRSLNGSIIPSERPGHFMMERYNPLKGHVGIISAFNFPCAVFYWNVALSLICGNTNLWKPGPTVSLVSIASQKIIAEVLEEEGLPMVSALICGDADVGIKMSQDPNIELLSFTGSTRAGREAAKEVVSRFGKHILELGGNNAMVVLEDANIDLALNATLFSAVGTAGQRCTTLRRLYLHDGIYDSFLARLVRAYQTIPMGNPLTKGTLLGPLHNETAVNNYLHGIKLIKEQGGKILTGGKRVDSPTSGYFVEPTIVEISHNADIIQEEIFAPILYVMKIKNLDQAIAYNNDVPQGLSSSLFTTNQAAIFQWTGSLGSDCGIVNVNIGPSGAEIGGAFGGEKATGGGRESGSDAWKQYMRRSTCTVNYSKELPLAQGIKFN